MRFWPLQLESLQSVIVAPGGKLREVRVWFLKVFVDGYEVEDGVPKEKEFEKVSVLLVERSMVLFWILMPGWWEGGEALLFGRGMNVLMPFWVTLIPPSVISICSYVPGGRWPRSPKFRLPLLLVIWLNCCPRLKDPAKVVVTEPP